MADEIQVFSDLKKTLNLYRITEHEIKAIKDYAPVAMKHIETFIEAFYEWLPNIPEYRTLFSRPGLIIHVKKKQIEYWRELFTCNLDEEYLQSRFKVGDIHATIHLPISSYIAGMSFAADWWIEQISNTKSKIKDAAFLIGALTKLFSMDIGIISASYTQASNDLIEKQSRALLELSTPTIQLWEGVLVLPILGVLDSRRAQDMTDVMLHKIQETSAITIIIDITGVPTVDSGVANHLIKITKATKLMGCECILSGIGPEIAQTLVHLGINLAMIETSSNLKAAFQQALIKAGYQIKLANKGA